MAVNEAAITGAIAAIGSVHGVLMDPRALVEDAILLGDAFYDQEEYVAAVAATVRALQQLVSDGVLSAALKYEFGEWRSYHYQHRVAQGAKADMRIIFAKKGEDLIVLGFGMRNEPDDIYARLAETRLSR